MAEAATLKAEGTDALPTLDTVIESAQDAGAYLAKKLSFLYGVPVTRAYIADVRDAIAGAQRELADADSTLVDIAASLTGDDD